MRIELTTSSLPRKCSTPELQQLINKTLSYSCSHNSHLTTLNINDRLLKRTRTRGPIAWKAIALPTELLPLKEVTNYIEITTFNII